MGRCNAYNSYITIATVALHEAMQRRRETLDSVINVYSAMYSVRWHLGSAAFVVMAHALASLWRKHTRSASLYIAVLTPQSLSLATRFILTSRFRAVSRLPRNEATLSVSRSAVGSARCQRCRHCLRHEPRCGTERCTSGCRNSSAEKIT